MKLRDKTVLIKHETSGIGRELEHLNRPGNAGAVLFAGFLLSTWQRFAAGVLPAFALVVPMKSKL